MRTGCWPGVGPRPLCISKLRLGDTLNKPLLHAGVLPNAWGGTRNEFHELLMLIRNRAFNNSCLLSSLAVAHVPEEGTRQSSERRPRSDHRQIRELRNAGAKYKFFWFFLRSLTFHSEWLYIHLPHHPFLTLPPSFLAAGGAFSWSILGERGIINIFSCCAQTITGSEHFCAS